MTQSIGRAFAIKISDGAGGFQFFAGMTGKSLSINISFVDVTVGDQANPANMSVREQLADTKSIDLSGDGRTMDDAAQRRLIAMAASDAPSDTFQISHPNLGEFEGVFVLTDLELGDDGATTFSVSLQSQGAIAYTAPA